MQSPTSWLTVSRVALRSPIHSTRTTGELQRSLSSPPPPCTPNRRKRLLFCPTVPPACPHVPPLLTCVLASSQIFRAGPFQRTPSTFSP